MTSEAPPCGNSNCFDCTGRRLRQEVEEFAKEGFVIAHVIEEVLTRKAAGTWRPLNDVSLQDFMANVLHNFAQSHLLKEVSRYGAIRMRRANGERWVPYKRGCCAHESGSDISILAIDADKNHGVAGLLTDFNGVDL